MNASRTVKAILDKGKTQEDIATYVRKTTGNRRFSQATVSRIKNGADTSFTVGQALEKLHDEVSKQAA
ncbi:MAG TPA: hypothetical protein VGH91_04670 [Gammaproteobacteria bacterium]|jgi:hypothetical protein